MMTVNEIDLAFGKQPTHIEVVAQLVGVQRLGCGRIYGVTGLGL